MSLSKPYAPPLIRSCWKGMFSIVYIHFTWYVKGYEGNEKKVFVVSTNKHLPTCNCKFQQMYLFVPLNSLESHLLQNRQFSLHLNDSPKGWMALCPYGLHACLDGDISNPSEPRKSIIQWTYRWTYGQHTYDDRYKTLTCLHIIAREGSRITRKACIASVKEPQSIYPNTLEMTPFI